MPVMDGVTAARSIIAALGDAAPPIVALTASCSDEEKQRCADAGFTAHLSKPMCVARMGTLRDIVLQRRSSRAAGRSSAAAAFAASVVA